MADTEHVLRPEEAEHLDSARAWVKGFFTRDPDGGYATIDGKLLVIDALLQSGQLSADHTWQLQALGIAFGNALAQNLGMNWVTVEDKYGRDPALHWPGTSVLAYPMTMISKRVERGELVDIREMFEGVSDMLRDMVAKEQEASKKL